LAADHPTSLTTVLGHRIEPLLVSAAHLGLCLQLSRDFVQEKCAAVGF
jgi:hypothetical protein